MAGIRHLSWLVVTVGLCVAGTVEAREVRIVGSSSMFPLMARSAQIFAATTPHVAPVVERTGTGGGFKQFCLGLELNSPDLVAASRPITGSEYRRCLDAGVTRISAFKVGLGGIALVQSKASEPLALSRRQLWMALAREVPVDGKLVGNPYQRWSDIDAGLPDRAIRFYGPPPTSGTRDGFIEGVMSPACADVFELHALSEGDRAPLCEAIREDAVFIDSGENDDMLVHRVAAAPEAIGIVAFNSAYAQSALLEVLSLDGVRPTPDTLKSRAYPLTRELSVYVKVDHIDAVPSLESFLDFLTREALIGPDGYLESIGLIPLGAEERKRMAEIAKSRSLLIGAP